MSPGDGSYAQPYFYVSPWPHLDPTKLPDAPAPGHWHREGFVAAVATAEELLAVHDSAEQLARFVDAAFAVGRQQLGR